MSGDISTIFAEEQRSLVEVLGFLAPTTSLNPLPLLTLISKAGPSAAYLVEMSSFLFKLLSARSHSAEAPWRYYPP